MRKKNKIDLENKKNDLTEEELFQNIAQSNQDTTLNIIVENKKHKKHKKITYISIVFGFIFVLIGTLLLFTKDNIKYDENFTITSIKPKSNGSYITNNETFVIETSSANVDMVREHLYVEPAVNYEIKNVLIKPNSIEEHSIYVEVELEIFCNVFEKKELNIIQDLYSPTENLNINQKIKQHLQVTQVMQVMQVIQVMQ